MTEVSFREWMIQQGVSNNTADTYTYALKTIKEKCGTNEKKILQYLKTQNRNRAAAFNKYMEYLDLEIRVELPKLDKTEKLPKYHDQQTNKQLLIYFEEYTDYPEVIQLMQETGVRISEALSIKQENINITDNSILITGKGKKQRTIYPSPELIRQLRKRQRTHPNKEGYCFPSPHTEGQPVTAETIRRYVRDAREEIGMPGLTPHRIRHTYATNLLREGTPLRTIQKALGHSSPETTAIYTHVFDTEIRAASKTQWQTNTKNNN